MAKELLIKDLKSSHKRGKTWPMAKRVEAVTQYLVLGNMALVSAVIGVDHQLLRRWKMAPWWSEMEAQIRATENIQVDGKLTKIVDKTLDAVLDRVENGDFIYDGKTGKIRRKPANLQTVAKVATEMLTKRELLRGNATERKETTQVSIADQLKSLALEFSKWSKPKQDAIDVETIEIIEKDEDDAIHDQRETGLQKRGSEVYQQAGSSQEADGAECSPT